MKTREQQSKNPRKKKNPAVCYNESISRHREDIMSIKKTSSGENFFFPLVWQLDDCNSALLADRFLNSFLYYFLIKFILIFLNKT